MLNCTQHGNCLKLLLAHHTLSYTDVARKFYDSRPIGPITRSIKTSDGCVLAATHCRRIKIWVAIRRDLGRERSELPHHTHTMEFCRSHWETGMVVQRKRIQW